MGSNRLFALVLALAGLYLLLFHIVYAPAPCVGPSLCTPPSPFVSPSPVVVAWADLVVGGVCVVLGTPSGSSRARAPALPKR
jgi:hypothetical protein